MRCTFEPVFDHIFSKIAGTISENTRKTSSVKEQTMEGKNNRRGENTNVKSGQSAKNEEKDARVIAVPASAESTRKEIKIRSKWADECTTPGTKEHTINPKLFDHDQLGNSLPADCFRIDHVFSQSECRRLVRRAETEGGFGTTHYRKTYRGNLRLITEDQSLADALWTRLRPFVPATVETMEKGERKKWKAVGLNECWRLAKYHPGDHFGRHYDTHYQRYPGNRSMYTFVQTSNILWIISCQDVRV